MPNASASDAIADQPAPEGRGTRALVRMLAKAEPLVVLGCVLVGIVLRFTPATPMWLDEALTTRIARAPLGQIDDLLRHDGHPPLYYYLLHGWMAIFGSSTAAVRALSGVIGVAVITLMFVVARRIEGPRTARAAVAVMATSPFAIRYSSEARMYELVVLLMLVGWLLLQRTLFTDAAPSADTQPATPWLALVGIWLVTGVLLLTHYWAIFLLAAVGLGLVTAAWRARDRQRRRAFVRVIVAVVLGGVWFVPWLSAFAYQSAHTGTPWAPASRPTRVLSESLIDWSGGIDPEAILLLGVLSVLMVIGIFGRRERTQVLLGAMAPGWRRRAVWALGATFAIGAAASMVSSAAFAGRYSSVVFALFVLLVAAGVGALPGAAWRTSALCIVAVLSLATVALAMNRDRSQAGEVAAVLRSDAQPGDLVVACPDQLGPALARLVPAEVHLVRYPDLGDPTLVDWVDYAERLNVVSVAEVADRIVAQAGSHRIWLAWSGTYRVAGPQCDELSARLAAMRPGTSPLVQADTVKFFESESLILLEAH